jgi:hypothetical protein
MIHNYEDAVALFAAAGRLVEADTTGAFIFGR